MTLERALEIIAVEDIFWTAAWCCIRWKSRKVELGRYQVGRLAQTQSGIPRINDESPRTRA